jgi:hypothetical protein
MNNVLIGSKKPGSSRDYSVRSPTRKLPLLAEKVVSTFRLRLDKPEASFAKVRRQNSVRRYST